MSEYNNFIEDDFKNSYEKSKEGKLYRVVVRSAYNNIDVIEDAVDVCFNNSVLAISSVSIISYYRIKNLISWTVEERTNENAGQD